MTFDLSSDVLERQFGPTHIAVLLQDTTTRSIQTQTIGDTKILELSRVTFIKAGVRAFPVIHEQVAGGQSMGKAFRAAGVPFVRHTTSVSRIALPDQFARRFKADGMMWAMEVEIRVGAAAVPYATVIETYSPAVNWPETPTEPTEQLQAAIVEFNRLLASLD